MSEILPNFSEDPDQSPERLPCLTLLKKASVKVAIEHDAKTFQMTENLQKVFGLDISYEKSVPPIGAPNATLTPAEQPAAVKHLLFSSFYKNLKSGPIGR